MQRQIDEDLEPFRKKGVTIEAIDATIKDVQKVPSGVLSSFVRYEIKDNKISWKGSADPSDARVTYVVDVLKEMAEQLGLPDLVFLASLWDSYDNPVFLETTYCPVFAICKLKGNRCGVLYPEFRFFSYRRRLFDDISWTSSHSPWEQKITKAFWRGIGIGESKPSMDGTVPHSRSSYPKRNKTRRYRLSRLVTFKINQKVDRATVFFNLGNTGRFCEVL